MVQVAGTHQLCMISLSKHVPFQLQRKCKITGISDTVLIKVLLEKFSSNTNASSQQNIFLVLVPIPVLNKIYF